MDKAHSREASGSGGLSQAKLTQINHGIYQFANALSVIFVNLYLWRLTNDLWINGAFNLITLISAPLATIYIGRIAKQKDRLLAYRMGIFLTALFYLMILVARESMVDYYVLFALMKGVSTAFYWLGHFTMIYDVTQSGSRHKYIGFNQIITNSAMLAGPALAGILISRFDALHGYTVIYSLAFALFLAASLLSLKLKPAPMHHKTYYLRYTGLMVRKHPSYGRALAGWFVAGLPQGIMAYVPSIILYQALPEESFVGYMNVGFTGLAVLSSYLLARKARTEGTRTYLTQAALGFVLSSLPLLWGLQLWTVVLFMAVYSWVKPLQVNAFTAHYYDLSSGLPLGGHYRIEAVVMRETAINMGRALGVLIFMMFSGPQAQAWMPWVLVAVMASQLWIARLTDPPAAARVSAAG
ncbi:MFS transporter [Paenibacillus mucilaginosus]|uniref:MFS transporter n=1 Tax=Paenibacillus mucilaginosus (strain KNP414) TaxID=1036673 RepID=F8FH01_PAEMK|nr:MFS transporter [Paenibacillus mucilaginosus]AEI46302.1 hypothetical protein KNP414_07816 [Paenibacillus mucilaginosus KNP414]MCG7213583.1 MFS transporter [Paenibacillus mucilaginosus]WDM27602.1 MFS transporter [Paenibacillus mucilaginosus]